MCEFKWITAIIYVLYEESDRVRKAEFITVVYMKTMKNLGWSDRVELSLQEKKRYDCSVCAYKRQLRVSKERENQRK